MKPDFSRSRSRKKPQHDNDIEIARYYYGIKCPHCKDMTPFIQNLQTNLIGGFVFTVATDDVYDVPQSKNDQISSKMSDAVQASMKQKPPEVTPTIHWSDGLVTEGAPYKDGHEINGTELSEYLCVRAAKCYLKEARPDMHDEEIHQLTQKVFGGRMVMERNGDGEPERNPYKGLREICWRF